MWARIMGNQLVEIIHRAKPMTINNIQYPSSIFTSAWTNAERKITFGSSRRTRSFRRKHATEFCMTG